MTSLLFNAPSWLIVLLALAGIGVTFTGIQRLQKPTRNVGLAFLGLAALLFVLRGMVETDEKRVEKNARATVQAISKQDWDSASAYLKYARMYDWDGEQLVRQAKTLSTHYGLTGVTVNSVEVKREPNVIIAIVSVTSSHKNMFVDSVPSTWTFEYQKREGRWMLTSMTPSKIGVGNTFNPEDIIRMRVQP